MGTLEKALIKLIFLFSFAGEPASGPGAKETRARAKVFAAAGICLTSVATATGGAGAGATEAAHWQARLGTGTNTQSWSTGAGQAAKKSAKANHNTLQRHQGQLHHSHVRAGGTGGVGHSSGPEYSSQAAQRVSADIRPWRIRGGAASVERLLQH